MNISSFFEPEIDDARIVLGVKKRLRGNSNCAKEKGAMALYLLSLYWHIANHRSVDHLLGSIADMDCGLDTNAWTFVSMTLAIKCRRDRLRGDPNAALIVNRIRARGFAPERLQLNMVRIIEQNLNGAITIGSRVSQIGWLEMLCGELIFVTELSPSSSSLSALEIRLSEAIDGLKSLVFGNQKVLQGAA